MGHGQSESLEVISLCLLGDPRYRLLQGPDKYQGVGLRLGGNRGGHQEGISDMALAGRWGELV